jgi:hypothetical protein
MESFEDYLDQLANIDASSVRVTNAIQKDMLPINQLIRKHYFSWDISFEDLYPKNSLAQEFIPESFPSFRNEKLHMQLDGFYAGVIAARVGEFEKFEKMILDQIKENT